MRSYNAINGTNFEPQDITKWDKDIDVDFIMHGSPCTDFSTAGLQKGGDEGSETRSSLMYESIRIIQKLKPRYVLWENVANLLSDTHIHNFQKYVSIMKEFGYNSYAKKLNAKDYGIPQNRERVFTVSIREDIDNEQFFFKQKQLLKLKLKDLLETSVDEKYYLSDEKIASISHWNAYQKPLEKVLGNNSISPTLTARGAGEEHAGMVIYSEDFENDTNVQELLNKNTIKYKGKQVELPAICASRGRKLDDTTNEEKSQKLQQTIEINTENVSNCLTTVEKDNYVIEQDNRNKKQQLCDYMIENNLVEQYDVINHGYTGHRFKSLKENKNIVMGKNIAPTLMTRPDELGVAVNPNQNELLNTSNLRIRKLTPRECWRLMGFDDEDFDKASKVNKSAALYEQAGNSIVVNVLEAVIESIFGINEKSNKSFAFPKKKKLDKSFYEYLEPTYDVEKVVLTQKEINDVKGINVYKIKRGYPIKLDYIKKERKIIKGFKKKKKCGFVGKFLQENENIYPTITASYGKVSGFSAKFKCKEGFRILTDRECWRLMGFDEIDFENAAKVNSSSTLYEQAGNSIVVNVIEEIIANLFVDDKNVCKYRIYKYHKIIDNIVKALLKPKIIDENGNANVEFWDKYGSFFLTIEKYDKLENIISKGKYQKGLVPQMVIKILEIAIIKLSEVDIMSEAKYLDIDITEIIQMLGKDITNLEKEQAENTKQYYREQIRIALQILRNVKIKFKEAPTGEYIEMRICKNTTKIPTKSSKGLNEKEKSKKEKVSVEMTSTLHFVFRDELRDILLKDGKDISIPLEILQYDEKYDKHYYLIYKKLLAEINTEDEVIIRVNDIYKCCVTLPRLKTITEQNRAYSARIRQPIEDVLNSINEFEWKYVDKNPITFREWLETSIIIKRKDGTSKDTKVA